MMSKKECLKCVYYREGFLMKSVLRYKKFQKIKILKFQNIINYSHNSIQF